jgi:hypothetical protein
MDMQKIFGVVRHIIGGIGAGLIGFGFANQGDITQVLTSLDGVVGGVMAIAAVVASVVSKIKGKAE